MALRRSKRLQNKFTISEKRSETEAGATESSDTQATRGYHPFELCPQEAWHFIMDKLSPSDGYGYAASKTSRCLTALHDRRGKSLQLFGLILPFLEWDYIYEQRKAMLTCRLVCRKWKDAVDNYLQSEKGYSLFCIRFSNVNKIHRFMKFLSERSSSKPFLARYFRFSSHRMERYVEGGGEDEDEEIEGDDPNDAQELMRPQIFWNAVTELLTSFGEHIWGFEYCSDDEVEQNTQYWVEIYTNLKTFTALMPNLKVLHVGSFYLMDGTHYHEPIQVGSQLQAVMDANPRLLLAHLKGIDLGEIPEAMTRSLVSCCAAENLTSLRLGSDQGSCAEIASKFPNLRYVDLWIYNSSTLSKLERMPWQLTEAVFNVKLSRRPSALKGEGITFARLFDWLIQFEGTLCNLRLTLFGEAYYRCTEENGDMDVRLRLPSLKKLEVTGKGVLGISSLEFARDLKQLEVLTLSLNNLKAGVDPYEDILFRGYHTRMLESNVWEVLPCLRTLVLEDFSGRYKYDWGGSSAASRMQVDRRRGGRVMEVGE